MKKRVVGVLASCVWLHANSQETTSLDGLWLASFPRPDGVSQQARVSIADGKGTFQAVRTRLNDRENPCSGQKFPVTVTNLTADSFLLRVEGSKALAGCPDFRWKLQRSEGGGYEGTFPNGQKYVLVRQP